MRVPPLFIIDEFLRIGLGLPSENLTLNETDVGFKVVSVPDTIAGSLIGATTDANLIVDMFMGQNFYQSYFMIAVKFILCCLGEKKNIVYYLFLFHFYAHRYRNRIYLVKFYQIYFLIVSITDTKRSNSML